MQIVCSYIKTRYSLPEVDFTIAVYRPAQGAELTEDFVAKGNGLPLDSFLDITFHGAYVEDDNGRGPAFIVQSYSTQVRKTRASVLGYLSSGAIKGVGTATAKQIVNIFGLEAVEILQKHPQRLREIKGIGEQKLQTMMESFEENRDIHDLMEYLGQFGISVNKVRRIVKTFGEKSLEIVRSDIYHLCEVDGFGFATVDDIALKMGYSMSTMPRVKAAAVCCLGENRQNGHLYMEPDDFLCTLKNLLNHNESSYIFDDADLRPMANKVLQSEKIAYTNQCIYLKQDYITENGFAVLMARRLYRDRQEETHTIKNFQIVHREIKLSPEQEKAVIMALSHNTCIITGGPGTGKSATRFRMKSTDTGSNYLSGELII